MGGPSEDTTDEENTKMRILQLSSAVSLPWTLKITARIIFLC